MSGSVASEAGPACQSGSTSRSELDELQLVKLRHLLATLLPANRFYSRKISAAEIGSSLASIAQFQRLVPFTTKHELVKDRLEHPPYGSNLTYPLEHYVRCHQTSGSTAVPIRWLDTRESWAALLENWARIFAAAGVRHDDRFFFAFSFGPFLGFWSAIEAVHRQGWFCFSGGGMSTTARAQAILDNRITVLCCTPTYAQHLGETARQKGIDLSLSRVRLVIVAGEAGGSIPATRSRIAQLWPGAQVFDHHGMTEVGPVSYQCPAQPGRLHILEESYLAEVIDPRTGEPAEPGQTGELVLTTLDRIGSPALRYRTGDLVTPLRGPCRCGTQDLTLQGGILGRADDMVVVRGVNVYPGTVEEIVRRCPEVGEYLVEVDSRRAMLELNLCVELTHSSSQGAEAVRHSLEEAFQAALNLRVPVRVVPPGTLPRYEMKARRWVRVTEGVA